MELLRKKKIVSEIAKQIRDFRRSCNEDPDKIILTKSEWDMMIDEVDTQKTLKKFKYKEYWKEENKELRPCRLFGVPIEPEPPNERI